MNRKDSIVYAAQLVIDLVLSDIPQLGVTTHVDGIVVEYEAPTLENGGLA